MRMPETKMSAPGAQLGNTKPNMVTGQIKCLINTARHLDVQTLIHLF